MTRLRLKERAFLKLRREHVFGRIVGASHYRPASGQRTQRARRGRCGTGAA